ncbi:MAG: hypothetical protein MUD01_12395 [Chloroflexaceae bacterium]|jgi:ribonuclease HIII|nr:hypothetical protein [Chloroflexaceae bacterium]
MTGLDACKRFCLARGWRWQLGKSIPYGEQIIISDGEASATLDFYPKRGRMVVGGADSALKSALRQWVEAQIGPPASAAAPTAAPAFRFTGPHMGLDESGKGDWFGPLVVAAVYVDAHGAAALAKAGVRDSKEFDSGAIGKLATQIEQTVPVQQRHVLVLQPALYNERYRQHQNINLLLAALYAEAAAPVQQASGATTIVCDQFSQRADRLERAFAALKLPRPTQQHGAEGASVAVAAASILARAAFDTALETLGLAAGLGRALPRGASDLRALERAAATIVQRHGAAALGQYAKLNFKPVQAFTQP